MLLCHKLFNAHTHVLILSYASLHLPIAGIQEKHNEYMNDWETKKKKEGRKKKGDKKRGKGNKEDNWIEETALSPYKLFLFFNVYS